MRKPQCIRPWRKTWKSHEIRVQGSLGPCPSQHALPHLVPERVRGISSSIGKLLSLLDNSNNDATVMQRAILHNGGKSLQHVHQLSKLKLPSYTFTRPKSQLSAIAKGLRRSKSAPRSVERVSRPRNTQRDDTDPSDRPRRPNHATRQVGEDQRASWQVKAEKRLGRKGAKRENYLSGGRSTLLTPGDTGLARRRDVTGDKPQFDTSRTQKFENGGGGSDDNRARLSGRSTRMQREERTPYRGSNSPRSQVSEDPGMRISNGHSREHIGSTGRRDARGVKPQSDSPHSLSHQSKNWTPNSTKLRDEDGRPEDYQGRFAGRMQKEERSDPPRTNISETREGTRYLSSSFQSRTPDGGLFSIRKGSQSGNPSRSLEEENAPDMTPRKAKSTRAPRSRFPWEDESISARDDATSSRGGGTSESPRNGFARPTQMSSDMEESPDDFKRGRRQVRETLTNHTSHERERLSDAPVSIPYTTPASEFLYGTSVVSAALKAERRKLYKLYIYDGDKREVAARDSAIYKLGLQAHVKPQYVGGDWIRMLDKMSTGRPHNVSTV